MNNHRILSSTYIYRYNIGTVLCLFRAEGREPGDIRISCHTETYDKGTSGRSRAFCTDRNMTAWLYPGGNVQTEMDREIESWREQNGQQSVVSAHFSNHMSRNT